MRGDTCSYDHGPDPLVVENSALKEIVRENALYDTTSTTYGVNPPPPGLETTSSSLTSICSSKMISVGGTSEGRNISEIFNHFFKTNF